MIIKCDECSLEFYAKASDIGPGGRIVRCSSCGHEWICHVKESDLNEEAMKGEEVEALDDVTSDSEEKDKKSNFEKIIPKKHGLEKGSEAERRDESVLSDKLQAEIAIRDKFLKNEARDKLSYVYMVFIPINIVLLLAALFMALNNMRHDSNKGLYLKVSPCIIGEEERLMYKGRGCIGLNNTGSSSIKVDSLFIKLEDQEKINSLKIGKELRPGQRVKFFFDIPQSIKAGEGEVIQVYDKDLYAIWKANADEVLI